MARFVGAEYVMANILLELRKQSARMVSFDTLCEYGNYVQQRFNQDNTDVICLLSRPQFMDCVGRYPHCFQYYMDSDGKPIGVIIHPNTDIDYVEYRFTYFLPVSVAESLQKYIKEFKGVKGVIL